MARLKSLLNPRGDDLQCGMLVMQEEPCRRMLYFGTKLPACSFESFGTSASWMLAFCFACNRLVPWPIIDIVVAASPHGKQS